VPAGELPDKVKTQTLWWHNDSVALRIVRAASRWVWRGLGMLGTLWVVVTVTPVNRACIRWLSGPWTEARGDILVTLGNAVLDDGTIGDSSYWRSVYAARAWNGGGFREMWISGSGLISSAMRDFLVCRGIPSSAIRLEDRSTSTRENAVFTVEKLRGSRGSVVLLTSDYHMYRAYRAFSRAGLHVVPHPIPDAGKRNVQWRHRWTVFQDLAVEMVKVLVYRMRGWI
jgi:uncharacterized SAM-binding protein YcdF (DUF218 family)